MYLKAEKSGVTCGGKPVLLRGMGLGNWFLPEGYMWLFGSKCDRPRRMEQLVAELCGEEYAETFWERFRSAFITEGDVAFIKESGLNSVRLAMNARNLFWFDADLQAHFQPRMLAHLENLLGWCRKVGIWLILDMHGAPGGQTGTNIDDSPHDRPELFENPAYQEMLVRCWQLLAERYKDEPAIGGYDLLNEPLPDWNRHLWPELVPLYRRLINAIREIDSNHMIILEGAHWDTEFSMFEELKPGELGENLLLEIHKYWNSPDEESLADLRCLAAKLEMPLWMGEGGENTLDWYTTAFPMYERLGIGWSFWSYKKMATDNSPVTFAKPAGWDRLLTYLDGGPKPDREEAVALFDAYLASVAAPVYNEDVIRALLRKAPLTVPAIAFDAEEIHSSCGSGADFRRTSQATIRFKDGHEGEINWSTFGGSQPNGGELAVELSAGDALGFRVEGSARAEAVYSGDGDVNIQSGNDGLVWARCIRGTVLLERVDLNGE